MVFVPTVHVPLHSGSQSFSHGRSSVSPSVLQPLQDLILPLLLTIPVHSRSSSLCTEVLMCRYFIHSCSLTDFQLKALEELLSQASTSPRSPPSFLLITETHQWHQFPTGRLDEPILTASQFHSPVSSPRNLTSMSSCALAYLTSDCHHRKNGCNFWSW